MKYCVNSKEKWASGMADKVISNTLEEYSRQVFGFTRSEFDTIVTYDVLNIMSFYYSRMNAQQKGEIQAILEKEYNLSNLDEILEDLAIGAEKEMVVPLSCKLMDRLGDSRVTKIVYDTLFECCKRLTTENWNMNDSYSNYLMLLNVAFFNALSFMFHVKDSFTISMMSLYGQDSYDDLIESMYEKNLDNLNWDIDVDLDFLEDLIFYCEMDNSFEQTTEEELMDAVQSMNTIRREHSRKREFNGNNQDGFEFIMQKTGIRELKYMNIHGFECHFCEAQSSDEEYIIVYQADTRISDIIDDENAWADFQRNLYKEDIKQNNSKAMVYIIYILDDNSDNIPIQVIESNRTYGRKYVFTEEETITFINGIVKTSSDETSAVSPVQEWDKILREEHLTACMTEPYAAKKVEAYLSGQRFDADYVYDDDYAAMKQSKIPQIKWVKSLDTTGFREFCFDDKNMNFGQINLFYGANGSGKTSVLEAIEYALTSEVRRVKDFKIKLPTDNYPKLSVYDTEAGVHTFTPGFSKKNCKEIERVWYGVPVGRNKSNLNDNFNRFNAFDSEAAYKFIHESDNSEDSFATMFGNLMFGETVVDHEKKWQRFKKAFDERYTELRSELSNARLMAGVYEKSIAEKSENSKSEEIETGIVSLKYKNRARLPKELSERYPKLLEEMRIIRKYVDELSSHHMEDMTFATIEESVAETKRSNLLYTKQRREKSEEITKLAEDNANLKQKIFSEREIQSTIQQSLEHVNMDICNWTNVQNVLSNEETINLVDSLLEELLKIEKELYYIAKIEQRTTLVKFLKLDNYDCLSESQKEKYETNYVNAKNQKIKLENQYNEAKRAFGEKEQQAIELRRIGKILLKDSTCPLCGHTYENTQKLAEIIDNAVIVDNNIECLLSDIQEISQEIMKLESILDRQRLIEKAMKELKALQEIVPKTCEYGDNYRVLYEYLASKEEREKRKAEIIEQQEALDSQGFSIENINACRAYTNTDATYLEYKQFGEGTYDAFLNSRLTKIQLESDESALRMEEYENAIKQNEQKEELLKSEIHRLESMMEALDADINRDIEQALENIKTKFELPKDTVLNQWITKYHTVYDKCEVEIEKIASQSMMALEKEWLAEYKATIKKDEPMVERCAKAVQAFERMPSLNSFVEKGIQNNIMQISKFFKWMHHSGEFKKLDIDELGIYAVRGLNSQVVRTYEMSTGQRATIAMAVMFALHMAAPDAPQFLLLDEPLATMDDTQVLNVLDILKSMAEQNTQIFFTTANGIMINLFKECFKNTSFDYKEYEFVKRVNRPSEIREISINDTKTIEELTLDDLTLDFHQFAQIREILRRNQEKLVDQDEWEQFSENESIQTNNHVEIIEELPSNFYSLLEKDERFILDILVVDKPSDLQSFTKRVASFPGYRTILERINDKSVDFFGETVIVDDEALPYIYEEYEGELIQQHDAYYAHKK